MAHDQASSNLNSDSIFAIHGDLDGTKTAEPVVKEQFIGLVVGSEEFLLPISKVSEILMLRPITFVPRAPEFVDGVFNVRGLIVPAINLRRLMGYDRAQASLACRIIITKSQDITIGILVDGIRSVVALSESDIEDNNVSGMTQGADIITRLAKQSDKVRGILDVEKIIGASGANLDESESGESGEAAA